MTVAGSVRPSAPPSWWTADRLPRPAGAAALAAVVLVAASRSPYLLTRGRFWAEEGSLHFAQAWAEAFPGELLYVQTRTGYFNLFANLSASFASHIPLSVAPLATAWLSLGVLVLLGWVVLFWPSDLFVNAGAKLTGAALLVVGTLAKPEVWLNTINAQTYLALLTVVLLFVRAEELSRLRYGVAIAALAVAGLSGLYSIALVPLFVWVAWRRREARLWGLAAPLLSAAVVQVLVFATARVSGEVAESKLSLPGAGELARSGGGHLATVLLGPRYDSLLSSAEDGSVAAAAVVVLAVLAVVAVLALLVWRAPDRTVPALLVAAFAITEVLVQLGSFDGAAVGRYSVVPVGILLLLLVHGVGAGWDSWPARVGAGALVVVVVAGLAQFWTHQPSYLRCRDCPEWADEVDRHDAGERELRIWPYDRDQPWVMVLEPPA